MHSDLRKGDGDVRKRQGKLRKHSASPTSRNPVQSDTFKGKQHAAVLLKVFANKETLVIWQILS